MTKPVRIQLSRKKGWKMPPNTVKVDRTTPWGNPFTIQFCADWFELGPKAAREMSVTMFRKWPLDGITGWVRKEPPKSLEPLRGKNLACWCPLPEPGQPDHCHAAVLLEIANQEPTDER